MIYLQKNYEEIPEEIFLIFMSKNRDLRIKLKKKWNKEEYLGKLGVFL